MGYSVEKNTQVLLSLLKKHEIRKIIINPGTTNMSFAISVQQDEFFELYSCVDERSGAYMACGMADECGEPVVLSCTGATASRNYLPALTEAYYRKLPVLAVTSTKEGCFVGNNFSQVIDRSLQPRDTYKYSAHIPVVVSDNDAWECNLKINEALMKLTEGEGGPVHINLESVVTSNFLVNTLPDERMIKLVTISDPLPKLDGRKIGIFIGNHKRWNDRLLRNVDKFCECFDAVVIQDLTGKYTGKYGCYVNLIAEQENYRSKLMDMDLCIYIGSVSAMDAIVQPKEVWQVSSESEVKDVFRMRTTFLFNMCEEIFFEKYCDGVKKRKQQNYHTLWRDEYNELVGKIEELPFSTGYVARNIIEKIPANSIVYLGIYNCLRNFNYFGGLAPNTVQFYSNTGGFGIDGGCSTLIGMAVSNPNKIHFGFIGDLGFFYDMNSIGNKHIGNNVRFMIINNGTGMEMELYSSGVTISRSDFGYYCSAKGHFGNKSKDVVKHFAQDMGFVYLFADNEKEFSKQLAKFVDSEQLDKPIIMEVFTKPEYENKSIQHIRNLKSDKKSDMKNALKGMLSENQKTIIKKLIRG